MKLSIISKGILPLSGEVFFEKGEQVCFGLLQTKSNGFLDICRMVYGNIQKNVRTYGYKRMKLSLVDLNVERQAAT